MQTFVQTILAFGLIFGPVSAFAIDFADISLVKKLSTELTVNGAKGTVLVGPVTDNVTLDWESPGAAGCMSNWTNDALLTKGVAKKGTISSSRSFVLTCYAVGIAQTVKVNVNLGQPDLTISDITLTGLVSVGKLSEKKYKAGRVILSATAKNVGKLQATELSPRGANGDFYIEYKVSNDGKTWSRGWKQQNLTNGVSTLSAGATQPVEPFETSVDSGTKYYYQACIDSTNRITEGNEKDNCSRIIGPYTFVP